MPTENRSNDADGWIACDDGLHLIQMDKNLSHYGWVFRKVDGGLPYSVREATPHEMAYAQARQHLRIGVAQISGPAPAPQTHPEPIAWMVGTAIWWTKEEAERDAVATGKPIIPFGPMIDTGEVDRLRAALSFYADREHYHFESGNWDTVSGEPLNILWCGEEPDFIEDGSVARAALERKL
ncbi:MULTISPECIES: hypothetical protein [Pseudomonas]|uniref:hypothetical protein n=1 Tax=Pseudomonas TaxID=286 RepID=UPI001E387F69|nr:MULTISPECIES: hypothetical protein [Pseudomonas]MCE0912613.1 hypothetical protein [Pseudomonas kurunegalensis]WJR54066.1 hypothetical protein LU664_017025 [Pseudomonas kurunegalensis]WMM94557.1 hypothetical protein [Pseudomonas kurunegalensis]